MIEDCEYTVSHTWYISHHCVSLIKLALSISNLSSQSGDTPLIIASYFGHPSVVRVLLQAGAIINTTAQVRYRLLHPMV